MSVPRTRTVTVTALSVLAAGTLLGPAAAAASSEADPAASQQSAPCTNVPDPSFDWPAELPAGTRLFVNSYRSFLVEVSCDGVPTLVLSTGFDSCWFMTQNYGVLRYPC
jgi:hypothetical protein